MFLGPLLNEHSPKGGLYCSSNESTCSRTGRTESSYREQAYWLLYSGFMVAPIIAGLDKFLSRSAGLDPIFGADCPTSHRHQRSNFDSWCHRNRLSVCLWAHSRWLAWRTSLAVNMSRHFRVPSSGGWEIPHCTRVHPTRGRVYVKPWDVAFTLPDLLILCRRFLCPLSSFFSFLSLAAQCRLPLIEQLV
jgi:hypothetical protein